MCVCVAKPVAVELRCHATALILVISKAQFRRAMLSCGQLLFIISFKVDFISMKNYIVVIDVLVPTKSFVTCGS